MKNIFTGIIVLFISIPHYLYSQEDIYFPTELNFKKTKSGGGIAFFNKTGKALFRISVFPIDEETTYYYPLNKIDDYKNFSYFTSAQKIGLYFSISSSIAITDMRYRILYADASKLIDWSIPNGRSVKQNELNNEYTTNIFMDAIVCNNEVVTIQLYNIHDPESILTQIVSTRRIENPLLFCYATVYNTEVNKISNKPGATFFMPLKNNTFYDFYNIIKVYGFLSTNNSPYVYNIYLIRNIGNLSDTIPLNYETKKIDTSILKNRAFSEVLNKSGQNYVYWFEVPSYLVKEVGSYRLLAYPKFRHSNAQVGVSKNSDSINFTMIKFIHPKDKLIRYLIIILGSIFIVVLFLFSWHKSNQNQKLVTQKRFTNEARLKLASIRSQLNPHFVYNALSGIQNLLNKNDNENANAYLTKFSRLTRSVLNDAHKDLIPVIEEVKLLEDYLQMEQMRFGFQYTIAVAPMIDIQNTEIPPMLLQPFAENAIKHGMAGLGENGLVTVNFSKNGNDLLIVIKDNGSGFDPQKAYPGKGITLLQNRVSLLNTVYKNSPFDLQIHSGKLGTEVIITIKNWLS